MIRARVVDRIYKDLGSPSTHLASRNREDLLD